MATISFLVNGAEINHEKPRAWVTIEEIEDGLLLFRVKQVGGAMGNLHGIYFDMTDESILNTLRIAAVSNNICISEDSDSCLQNGTYASNSFVADKIKDTDQTAGKSNVGNDGISNYSFTVRSTARALSLCDFFRIYSLIIRKAMVIPVR
ncbi:hypothetical protein [Nitrosomonas sp.]|uniref:hypothetical protein n=1 Tax=Nitrosomonas sp. TaxID=42353 RepID=UPI002605219C|nr:hypothetical protein [Nitrosomonas sp.]